MITSTLPARSAVRSRAVTAAGVATATSAAFVVILAALHVLKPDYAPTWRMVSEYEIGRYGILMQLAFVLSAISFVATARTIAPLSTSRPGRIARGALYVTAAGLVLAAFATADPVTSSKDQLTTHGNLHGLAAMIGMPAFLIAALATNRALRHTTATRAVRLATRFAVSTVALFALSMATMFHGAPMTPDVRIGIQNRLMVVAYAIWATVTARAAQRASATHP